MKRYSFQRRKIEKFFERLVVDARLFKYRNILFLIASILLAWWILKSAPGVTLTERRVLCIPPDTLMDT